VDKNQNVNKNQNLDFGFLDLMYVLAIFIGLKPDLLGVSGPPGLLSEDWIQSGVVPTGDASFNLCTFILGLLTVSFSWFGYHRSITGRPYRYDSALSMFRFVIDIFLLVAYGLLLLQFRNLKAFMFFVTLNYLMYFIWDIIKVIEFKETIFKKREVATFITFILLFILWLLSGRVNRWFVLIAATIVTVGFRLSKVFIKVPARA